MLDGKCFGVTISFRGSTRPSKPDDGDFVTTAEGCEVYLRGDWIEIERPALGMTLPMIKSPRASENCVSCGALVHNNVCVYCGRRR